MSVPTEWPGPEVGGFSSGRTDSITHLERSWHPRPLPAEGPVDYWCVAVLHGLGCKSIGAINRAFLSEPTIHPRKNSDGIDTVSSTRLRLCKE